ncbi:hypothetical protein ORI99_00660 [Alishewanella sp. SMS9]|nr:hypothetical protein [Alishewanella sp. SMS9]
MDTKQSVNQYAFVALTSLIIDLGKKDFPMPTKLDTDELQEYLKQFEIRETLNSNLKIVEPTFKWLANEKIIHLHTFDFKAERPEEMNISFTLTAKTLKSEKFEYQPLEHLQAHSLNKNERGLYISEKPAWAERNLYITGPALEFIPDAWRTRAKETF